jgi:hypothetical protein
MSYIKPNKALSRSQVRYYRLKAEGKCTTCGEIADNGKANCEDCLAIKSRRPLAFKARTVQPRIPITGQFASFGGFCTTPLRDVLICLGLRIKYFDDRYEFSGRATFSWSRDAVGCTPFDALRAKGFIQ